MSIYVLFHVLVKKDLSKRRRVHMLLREQMFVEKHNTKTLDPIRQLFLILTMKCFPVYITFLLIQLIVRLLICIWGVLVALFCWQTLASAFDVSLSSDFACYRQPVTPVTSA